MIDLGQAFLGLVLGLISLILWKIWPGVVLWSSSALKNLPGPPSPSWFWGQMKVIFEEDNSVPQERWAAQYGPTIKYEGFFDVRCPFPESHEALGPDAYGVDSQIPRLWTLDTRALNHILTNSLDYQRPPSDRRSLAKLLGQGLLFTEGEQHRQQRRILNPAFGPAQVRELTPIFVHKAAELRDLWEAQVPQDGGQARIDILQGLTKMTLDVIGLAGFNYDFDSLNPNGKPNELNEAFREVFAAFGNFNILLLLKSLFPVLEYIPDARSRRLDKAQAVIRRIGSQLIQEKKAAIIRERTESKAGVERKDVQGRDLLTILIKANMATDIPDSQRLSDEDVLAQIHTFLVAGHETTSTATTWCLYALTQAPDVQKKLRDELFTLDTDAPTMDQLNSLPYLDAVVRETLRVHAPVPTTLRVAMRDDVIPVSEPFVDRYGKLQQSIRISKGSPIIIPILSLNRSEKLWGEDAREFKPERWENPPDAASSVPGVWGHILSFLGGPRACIGYRFSLVEMKALIFTLVRAFEFELAVPAEDIKKKTNVVQQPMLRSAPQAGSQMPLLLRRYRRAQ
ncbi:cytochrome P450 [Trametes punicea]|nr:cytochrome P450 [Trametes punicea]